VTSVPRYLSVLGKRPCLRTHVYLHTSRLSAKPVLDDQTVVNRHRKPSHNTCSSEERQNVISDAKNMRPDDRSCRSANRVRLQHSLLHCLIVATSYTAQHQD
jgi:hypothetical protein